MTDSDSEFSLSSSEGEDENFEEEDLSTSPSPVVNGTLATSVQKQGNTKTVDETISEKEERNNERTHTATEENESSSSQMDGGDETTDDVLSSRISFSEAQHPIHDEHDEIYEDGEFRYTFLQPHDLVLTVETHVKMISNDISYEEELKNSEKENLEESTIEPFVGYLPLPPNCNLYRQALKYRNSLDDVHNHNANVNQLHRKPSSSHRKKSLINRSRKGSVNVRGKKLNTSYVPNHVRHIRVVKDPFDEDLLPNRKGIPVKIGLSANNNTPLSENNHDDSDVLEEAPSAPYNSVGLMQKTLGYVYEDNWQVEKSRPLICNTLLSPVSYIQNRMSTVDQQTKEKKDEKPKQKSSSKSNEEEDDENVEESTMNGPLRSIVNLDENDRSKWRSILLRKYPVMQELSERLYPLWRTVSFGESFNAGKKEVRKNLKEEHVMNIIMQHLLFEGLKKTKKVLEEESGFRYSGIDVDQSLLHSIAKEAIKKAEKLLDTVVCDKLTAAQLQKHKQILMKDIDEQLSELGIDNDGFVSKKKDDDTNFWKEPERQNEIVEVDPVSKYEHFQAGSLNRIIERLTLPANGSDQFIYIFLNTYMAITSPETVLSKLLQRFRVPKSFPSETRDAIQVSVIRLLTIWIENHFNHFTNNMLQKISSFLDEQTEQNPKLQKSRKTVNSLITKMRLKGIQNKLENDDVRMPEPKVPWNKIFSADLSIFDIDEEEMARQLCLFEYEIYQSIKSEELLNQAWKKPKLKNRAPNVILLTKHFNDISMWVASIICRGDKTYDRKHMYKKLIKICEHLKKMNNFNTLKAILNGFENGAVKRLKQTRDELGQQSKQSEASLKELMGEDNNNKRYKEYLKTISPTTPCIPYLHVHLQVLQYIEDNQNDYVKHNGAELINWLKRESIYEVIREILQYQESLGFKFIKVYQIQQYITQMPEKIKSQQALMMQSYRAEPPPGLNINNFNQM
ncbi:hypothetical protein ABK040_000059 [Willaertia magna]